MTKRLQIGSRVRVSRVDSGRHPDGDPICGREGLVAKTDGGYVYVVIEGLPVTPEYYREELEII